VEILEEMPADLKEIFMLTHYEGKRAVEISALLEIPSDELENRLRHANRIFFRALRRF
jgi:DNA-directed RNA polymerase specialized sigma24 family protein